MKNLMSKMAIGGILLSFLACTQDNQKNIEQLSKLESSKLELVDGIVVDTIIVFDPATGKETMEIVRKDVSDKQVSQIPIPKELLSKTGIDTIVTFDPKTYKERLTIINHDTGVTVTKDGQE